MALSPFKHHDHGLCINEAMDKARQLCAEKNLKLTKIRHRVLNLIWQSHQPVGAYDLLAQLSEEGFNSAPPTVYRALDFLQSSGLIHKLVSLNAYIGCCHPNTPHAGHFIWCKQCHQAWELDMHPLQQWLDDSSDKHQFIIEHQTVELVGLCAACQASAPISN